MKSKPEKTTMKAKPGKRQYKRDPEQVRQLLEWLGALILHADRGEITISTQAASRIVDILSSLPEGKIGRPKAWTYSIESEAIFDMLGGKSVNLVAREIAEKTGQKMETAERRLWALRETPRFKGWQKR